MFIYNSSSIIHCMCQIFGESANFSYCALLYHTTCQLLIKVTAVCQNRFGIILIPVSLTFIPAPVGCTSISTKQELEKAVAKIGDWEALCEHLGAPQTKLQELRFSTIDTRTKKSRCLEAYLDTGKACWEHVVKVVAEYPIENKRLAKKIADTLGIDYLAIVKEEL